MPSGCALPPRHVRRRLADAWRAIWWRLPTSETACAVNLGEHAAAATEALDAFARVRVTGRGAAAWLALADEATSPSRLPDLVWSGPEVIGLPPATPAVFTKNSSARPSAPSGRHLRLLRRSEGFRHDLRPHGFHPRPQVTLLLNIERKYGDTSSADLWCAASADRFWEWPGARRPFVYYDPVPSSSPCGGAPRKSRRQRRQGGLHHLRQPDRGRPRPQHRVGPAGARPVPSGDRGDALPRPDRKRTVEAAAWGVRGQ